MALIALELPKVGLVMENTRLVRWLKAVGDRVEQGEPLLELETEKSVVEIEATHAGQLVELLLAPDQEAHVGDRIAWLETGGDATVAAPLANATVNTTTTPAAPPAATVVAPPADAPARPAAPAGGRIRSSPVARRLANQHGLDLATIAGSGPRGCVQLADVRQALAAAPAAAPAPGLRPLTSMRRALARSMSLSNATVPQFAVTRTVDWTSVERVRAQLIAELPPGAPRPSVNDFVLQAMARTLLAFADLNATFHGDASSPAAGIQPAAGTHVGLVVALEQGLLVPVFHHAEQVSLVELARRRAQTVERALGGRLRREDLEGATVSVSNLGSRGPDRFTAIINPPQSAILAVGRQRDGVVVLGGGIHVRPVSELTLTVDHRLADGRLASDALAHLVGLLEGDPAGRPAGTHRDARS